MATDAGSRGLRDSGERHNFTSGAQRDITPGKGRYDLLQFHAISRLAQVLEKGVGKYSERNWEQGMPLSRYLDSAMRHLGQYMLGDEEEDHLGQALWNIACLIETEHWIDEGVLDEDLRDIPVKRKGDSMAKFSRAMRDVAIDAGKRP